MQAVEVKPVSVGELREDLQGLLVQEWAALSSIVFGEPPWDNEYGIARLIFGIGVDLMRDGAKAFVARTSSGRHVGHTLGYEIFRASQGNPRVTSLLEISGREEMNHLFDMGRLFYIDTVAVHPGFRGIRRITAEPSTGERLTLALIEQVRSEGFKGVILRTHLQAGAAKAIYKRLGFEELLVRDAEHPDRDYWHLQL